MSSNTPLIPTKKDTVKNVIGDLKTDQHESSQTENEKAISNDSYKYMALNKLTSLDKSRSSSRTETEDTVKSQTKTRSISSASLYDKDTKEQQPKEKMIKNKNFISDNRSVSSMFVHGWSATTILPYRDRIHRKN